MAGFRRGKLPVYDMLEKHTKYEKVSFHVPGHNAGKAFPGHFKKNFISLDTTELLSTDDLHDPSSAFVKATNLAAEAFGSGKTFFITEGSTAAVRVAAFSLTQPGDKIIIFRNSHMSIVNACMVFGLKLVYTNFKKFETTLESHRDAKFVFVTRPDYYGCCPEIKNICKAAHKHDIPVVTDEAHGTHLAFCPELFPDSALVSGSDVVIQSAHKTTPALTQGAYLHISRNFAFDKKSRVKLDIINVFKNSVFMLTTSSPSFLIAASLDYARYYLSEHSQSDYALLFKKIKMFHSMLDERLKNSFSDEYISFLQNGGFRKNESKTFDFTRICLDMSKLPLTAQNARDKLYGEGINVEFCDLTKIIFVATPFNTYKDFSFTAKILNSIIDNGKNKKPKSASVHLTDLIHENFSEKIHDFKDFPPKFGKTRFIELSESSGYISADCIIFYPPGIPVVLPGDTITDSNISLINACLDAKMHSKGIIFNKKNTAGIFVCFS